MHSGRRRRSREGAPGSGRTPEERDEKMSLSPAGPHVTPGHSGTWRKVMRTRLPLPALRLPPTLTGSDGVISRAYPPPSD